MDITVPMSSSKCLLWNRSCKEGHIVAVI